ncbi:hypothetical protein PG984_013655 [Apiospora sp. TS-2023a]
MPSRATLGKCFDCAQDNNRLCPPLAPATARRVARTLVVKLSAAYKKKTATHRSIEWLKKMRAAFRALMTIQALGRADSLQDVNGEVAVANEQLTIGSPLGSSPVSILPQDNKDRKDGTSQVIMFSSLAGSSLLLSCSVEN